jgi:multicomponent Na+:H+ antiporter subunit E
LTPPTSGYGTAREITREEERMARAQRDRWANLLAVATWAMLAWILLTWTTSVQVLVFGAVVAVLCAVALAPLGPYARPWRLLRPRRAWRAVALLATCLGRIVVANIGLARRIWDPRLPLRTGMLVIRTAARTPGGLAAVGLTSSLIVDNQLVDIAGQRLQYHAIDVEPTDPRLARPRILGSIDVLIPGMEDAQDGVDG